jgi:inorganic phosphate transporter, PiT family
MVSLLVAVVITALIFDFINGFHDAANAIATSVSTGALPIRGAVILAGIFNFLGAMAGTAVAGFIAKGLAEPADVTPLVVLAALSGAITWNLITWWYGIPSSSSHALVGGLMGAVVAHAGAVAFKWEGLLKKVVIPLFASPILGFVIALSLMVILLWMVRHLRPGWVHRGSRRTQLFTACSMAFSHGSNDAQKSMGIITMALLAYHHETVEKGLAALPGWILPAGTIEHNDVPMWVIVACALAIAFGTMGGGKRIIKTMGSKIVRIAPLQGVASDLSGSVTIYTASLFGIPVSTTHVTNACILGVGASKRISAVRWTVAINIVMAWFLTIPMSAMVSYLSMELLDWINSRM